MMMRGPFVPIEDVSKHFSVSVSTIRGWVRKGHIPKNTYIKVGNTYRFSIPDVSEALTSSFESEDENTVIIPDSIPDDHWSKEITADEDF